METKDDLHNFWGEWKARQNGVDLLIVETQRVPILRDTARHLPRTSEMMKVTFW